MENMSPRITTDKIYKSLAAYARARAWSPYTRKRWFAFIHKLRSRLCSGVYTHDSIGDRRIFHLELRHNIAYLLPKRTVLRPDARPFPVVFQDVAALKIRVLLSLHWSKETSWRKETRQLRNQTTYWTRKKTRRARISTPSDMTYHLEVTLPKKVVARIFSFLPTHTFTLPLT